MFPRPGIARIARTLSVLLVGMLSIGAVAAPPSCLQVGAWAQPGAPDRTAPDTREVMTRIDARRVVLLGENHDQADHHRWQLHMIAALQARQPDLVLGFEMFPRRVQQALDDWTAGRLTEEQFLAASHWSEVWGMDPKLYMPLFDFARMHRIRMVALNVDRALIRRTGSEGWASIQPDQREGIGDPAPATPAYLDTLYESFVLHRQRDRAADSGADAADAAKPSAQDMRDPEFLHFVESMQVWDRAMAEGIAAQLRQGAPMVVGIMGSGHLRNGFGVPHQLRDLGISDVAILLPWPADEDCSELVAGVADFVFGIGQAGEAQVSRPRLGITLDDGDQGVAIREVTKGSVAEQAGAKAGDIILAMAGRPVKESGDVIQVVQRQAPGTWLPMTVRRDGRSLDLVARFPPAK